MEGCANIMLLDVLALVLSLISLAATFLIARSDRKVEIKIAKTELMSHYFDEIYKDFLIERIPNARNQIRFDLNNKLQDIDPLVNELNAIQKKSLYFCYANPMFYKVLIEKLRSLEDYLVISEDTPFVGEAQTACLNRIKSEIEGIYQHITSHHQGNL